MKSQDKMRKSNEDKFKSARGLEKQPNKHDRRRGPRWT